MHLPRFDEPLLKKLPLKVLMSQPIETSTLLSEIVDAISISVLSASENAKLIYPT